MEAIYMGPWYKCDVKLRKMLLLIMIRCNKPMILSAGKTIDLSLQTFTKVLKKM